MKTIVKNTLFKSPVEGLIWHQVLIILRIKKPGGVDVISQMSSIAALVIYLSNLFCRFCSIKLTYFSLKWAS